MTQIIEAKKGSITKEMTEVAKAEGITPEEIQKGIAEGNIVICKNRVHKIEPARHWQRPAHKDKMQT